MNISIEQLYLKFLDSGSISIDTRKDVKGSMFFALTGKNHNGNQYIQQALQKECHCVISDEPNLYFEDQRVIKVSNSLQTLQQLGLYHRRKFNIPLIGVTGSNGKTTTKQLIYHVLSQKYNVLSTKGNLNNQIGVPLTLLNLCKEHDIAVIQMGVSHEGNMKQLLEISEPTHGIITNIMKAHIGQFISLQNIMKEKGQLYKYLKNRNGTIFVNRDDPILITQASSINKICYGISTTNTQDVVGKVLSDRKDLMLEFQWRKQDIKQQIKTQLVGTYNIRNCLAAISIGLFFDVSPQYIKKGITNYKPSNNRSQYKMINKYHMIIDCYNANPSSMSLSIDNFDKLSVTPKLWIIGMMSSLGIYQEEENMKIVEIFRSKQLDQTQKVFFIGTIFPLDDKNTPQISYLKTVQELIQVFKQSDFQGSYTFIKGSNSVNLSKFVDFISC